MNAADLTDDELAVLNALTDAWNRFDGLTKDSEYIDDMLEFKTAVRRSQRVMLARAARRASPGVVR